MPIDRPGLAQETSAPNEAAMIEAIVAMNLKTLARIDGVTRRGQHGKDHGCARAIFTVRQDVPERLRHGVFATPRAYEALVRFSNGTWYDDRKPDAHGMAIKLTPVEGPMLVETGTTPCQDFILVDAPTFFCAGADEYLAINTHYTKVLDLIRHWRDWPRLLARLLAAAQGALVLALAHPALLKRAKAFASRTLLSPLATHYWSTTPYLLGPGTAVKYMARAQRIAAGTVPSANGLADALAAALDAGPAAFDFGVCLQEDAAGQPIEDATVDWDPDGLRFIPLATLDLPRQSLAGSNAAHLAERLVFSPWHALEAHRPLGVVNRVRREVYRVMSRLRSEANDGRAP